MNNESKNESLDRAEFLYQICENAFQYEVSRFESLNNKANIYLTILGLLLGLQFIEFTEFQKITKNLPFSGYYVVLIFYIASIGFFMSALWKVMRAVKIADYRTYPRKMFEQFSEDSQIVTISTIASVLDESVEDIKVQNNKKAKFLDQSLKYIRFGVICLLTMFIIFIILQTIGGLK